jgi:hypothetical protein
MVRKKSLRPALDAGWERFASGTIALPADRQRSQAAMETRTI